MRNPTVYAVTTPLAITPDYVAHVVAGFTPSKKSAKQAKKAMIKHGIISAVGGQVVEINPTDWAVTFHNQAIADSFPLPLFKGCRFLAEAEHTADLFRQVLPPMFIVDVVKFDETVPYQHYVNNRNPIEQMGVVYA